jgi:low affinity Fe/Cu permease
MVFLLQNSQNRDMAALQVKLDEILRAIPEARNTIVGIDIDSDEGKIQEARVEVKESAGLPKQDEVDQTQAP